MEGNPERVHYMNTAYPYNGSEVFMDFFGGYSHPPLHYPQPPLMPHDHGSTYWSMNMNSYRFGTAAPENTSYYSPYTMNDELMRMDYHRTAWEYPSVMNVQEAATIVEEAHAVRMPSEEIEAHSVQMPSEETEAPTMQAIPEETQSPDGTFSQQDAATSQVVWEDNIDPDNMTYEELLDLGESVGTENRGLSQELIDLLPTSKYKSGGIFSRKKSEERCVICQMRYKRGDRQIHLPCKHVYHATCGSKWLSINKTCPVCNCEVILDNQGNEGGHI